MTQFYRLVPLPRAESAYSGGVVPLPTETDDSDRSCAGDSAWDAEREAKIKSRPGPSPDEVDLDQLMAKLKAIAAKAQQVPPAGTGNRRLVIAAAITLSIASGAVTAQYLIPGHSRASAAPSKNFAKAIPIGLNAPNRGGNSSMATRQRADDPGAVATIIQH